MKQTAKILKFKGKKLETVEEVRAALIAMLEDVQSGDATITEAKPIQEEIKKLIWKVRAQMECATPKDKAALKSLLGRARHGVHLWTLFVFVCCQCCCGHRRG